jgi:hypothetical protein
MNRGTQSDIQHNGIVVMVNVTFKPVTLSVVAPSIQQVHVIGLTDPIPKLFTDNQEFGLWKGLPVTNAPWANVIKLFCP